MYRNTRITLVLLAVVVVSLTLISCGSQPASTPIPATFVPTVPPTSTPLPYANLYRTGDKTWGWLYPSNPQEKGIPYLNSISCPNEKVCFIASRDGKVLTTTDGGLNWQQLSNDINKLNTNITCIDSKTCIVSLVGGKFAITKDAGQSWQEKAFGSTSTIYQTVCPSKTNCFASGENGLILVTKDAGQTWTQQISNTKLPLGQSMSCPTTTTCYITGGKGGYWDTDKGYIFLATTDGGNNWKTISKDLDSFPLNLSCPTVNICYGVKFYLTDTTPAPNEPIIKSIDGGTTWNKVGEAFNYSKINCPDEIHCYVSERGGIIKVTVDGGKNWIEQQPGMAQALGAVPCPTNSMCYDVDYNIYSFSCPTTSLCFTIIDNSIGDKRIILTNG
jgi:photosystem II stability/assembly factor-like uncharacterized protein